MSSKRLHCVFTAIVLSCLVVFSLVSCFPEPDLESLPGDIVITKDLKTIAEGDEFEILLQDGKNSTIALEGATIDSLYVIELQDGSGSRDLRKSRDFDSILSQSGDDVFVILPQSDGKLSFSGLDIGISNTGSFKIKKLGNNANRRMTRSGDAIFQYRVDNTEFNYRERNYPEYLWPTYLNFYCMNLNDPTWARFKNKQVVVYDSFITFAQGDGGGSELGNRFGLVDIGNIIYNDDRSIYGLYDLRGKDWLNIYSFLRTAFVDVEDFRYETYVLLPDEIQEGEDPFVITDLPHAIIFRDDFTKDKKYIVSIDNIPTVDDDIVLLDLIESNAGIRGTAIKVGNNNGEDLIASTYVKKIERVGDKYNLELFLTGVDEDFVIKNMMTHFNVREDYGAISFREATGEELNWVSNNCIDLSNPTPHAEDLDQHESFNIIWHVPEGDHKTYKLTVNATDDRTIQTWSNWIEGRFKDTGTGVIRYGSFTEEFYISGANPDGYCTILSDANGNTVTWKVEEVAAEGNPRSTLDHVEFIGKISSQRALSEIDPSEAYVIACYEDGTRSDVTLAPGLSCTTETGNTRWGDCLSSDDRYDFSRHHINFSYTENGVTRSTRSNDFRINGEKGPSTESSSYELSNEPGSYLTLDLGNYDVKDRLDVFDPIDPGDPGKGYLIAGADEGDIVYAFFFKDDYDSDNYVDIDRLFEVIAGIGADLEGTAGTVFRTVLDGSVTKCLVLSLDGTGTVTDDMTPDNETIVMVIGRLVNDVDPGVGIKGSDFAVDALKFYVTLVD